MTRGWKKLEEGILYGRVYRRCYSRAIHKINWKILVNAISALNHNNQLQNHGLFSSALFKNRNYQACLLHSQPIPK